MGLPTSCCCCITLQNGAKCFSTIRLVFATAILFLGIEEILNRRLHDYFRNGIQTAREDPRFFYYVYYGAVTAVVLCSLIEITVCSLQIHGIRKELHKLLLPNLIWSTFWCVIHGLGFLALLGIGIFWLVVVYGLELLVTFLVITCLYGSILVYIISDLCVSLAQYKEISVTAMIWNRRRSLQMNYCMGLEHIKLKEYVMDDKRRFVT